MPFTPKSWQDLPDTSTPISAGALVDLETRLSGYTDSSVTGLAPLASPAFTGTPVAPTAAALTNNTQLATTAYADAAVAVEKTRALAAEATAAHLIESVETIASSGATLTLADVTADTMHLVTLTANCTFTFPTAAAGKSFLLALVQGTGGSFTATWPGTVKWPGGTAPTLTTTATKTDIFSFVCADGTNWLGFTAGQNY